MRLENIVLCCNNRQQLNLIHYMNKSSSMPWQKTIDYRSTKLVDDHH